MSCEGIKNFCGKILAGCCIAILLFSNELKANDQDDKKAAYAPTTVSIDKTAVISGENVVPIYGISLDIDRDSLTSDSVSYQTITFLTSKPNSKANLIFQIPEESNASTLGKTNSAVLILRDEDQITLRTKININRNILEFDDKGKSIFEINSEFYPSNKQPNGTYRGFYYLIVVND
jgi:hypothetical protein